MERLELDRWFHDDHFADCTDGYLFTRYVRLVADACVAWFRDETGTESADDLGCDYRFPTSCRRRWARHRRPRPGISVRGVPSGSRLR